MIVVAAAHASLLVLLCVAVPLTVLAYFLFLLLFYLFILATLSGTLHLKLFVERDKNMLDGAIYGVIRFVLRSTR